MTPTADDRALKAAAATREREIAGLNRKLDGLAKEWSAAKLQRDKGEAQSIFNEMKEVQTEIRLLEKRK